MTHIQVKRSEYELWFKSLMNASERQQKPSEEVEQPITYKAVYEFKNQWNASHILGRFYGVGGINVTRCMNKIYFESDKDWFCRNGEIDKACRFAGGKKRVTEVLREPNQI